jgi:hypothetical protein
MPFKLTEKHLLDFLTPCEDGEWGPFMDALDPQVRWWITDDEENPLTAAGVYVRLSLSSDPANKPVDRFRVEVESRGTSHFGLSTR